MRWHKPLRFPYVIIIQQETLLLSIVFLFYFFLDSMFQGVSHSIEILGAKLNAS